MKMKLSFDDMILWENEDVNKSSQKKDVKKHIHWFAWWKMCIPKKRGGVSCRDIPCFNLAMLAKQVWRLLCEPDSLCARVLRARYFPSGDILNAELKKGSSFTWQSIHAGI